MMDEWRAVDSMVRSLERSDDEVILDSVFFILGYCMR